MSNSHRSDLEFDATDSKDDSRRTTGLFSVGHFAVAIAGVALLTAGLVIGCGEGGGEGGGDDSSASSDAGGDDGGGGASSGGGGGGASSGGGGGGGGGCEMGMCYGMSMCCMSMSMCCMGMCGMCDMCMCMGMGMGGMSYTSAVQQTQAAIMANRPSDFDEWTEEDYRSALYEGDPRLPKAIEHYAAKTKGQPEGAKLLTWLLMNVNDPPDPDAEGETTPEDGQGGAGGAASLDTNDYEFRTEGDYFDFNEGGYGDDSDTVVADAGYGGQFIPSTLATSGVLFAAEPQRGCSMMCMSMCCMCGMCGCMCCCDMSMGGGGGGGGLSYTQLLDGGGLQLDPNVVVRAVLKGLIENDSTQAWATVEELLKGTIDTGISDSDVVDLILESLMQGYGGPDHPTARLLTLVTTQPASLRSGGTGTVSAQELQQRAFDLHSKYASSSVDLLLGIHKVHNPQEDLLSNNPFNNEAGGNPGFSGASSCGMCDMCSMCGMMCSGMCSSMCCSMCCGMCCSMCGGGAAAFRRAAGGVPQQQQQTQIVEPPPMKLTADELTRVVNYLWQPEMINFVDGQVKQTATLSDSIDVLKLAGSFPNAQIRRSVFELLEKNWEQGADELIDKGLFDHVLHDPGMAVVLKAMPRSRPLSAQPGRRVTADVKAKNSWWNSSWKMTQLLNSRFRRAAETSGNSDIPVSDRPVPFQSGVPVQLQYAVDWPADLAGKVDDGSAPALKVRYFRMENNGPPRGAVTHYERPLRTARKNQSPTTVWFDSSPRGTAEGTRRSVDVVITATSAEHYFVEVLEVEVPDPSAAASNSETGAE